MDLKPWKEYTSEEKKQVLKHWWCYYGEFIVFPQEQEEFERLLDMDIDLIFDTALLSYLEGQNNKPLLTTYRNGRLVEFLNWVLIERNREGYKRMFPRVSIMFLDMCVKTMNDKGKYGPLNEWDIETVLRETEPGGTGFLL